MKSFVRLTDNIISFEMKDKIISIFWITFFWFLLGLYQYTDRYSVLVDNECIDDSYAHWPYLKGVILTVTLGGILVGTGLVFLWEKWLRKLAFIRAFIYIILFYSSFYVIITFLGTASFAKEDPSIILDNSLIKTVFTNIFSLVLLPNYLFWLFICLLTIIFLLIRDKFGPKTFGGFLTGKYFRPKREERIFMFMDLKSSTTIAEKLGEEKYFNFLNDTFKLSTPGILATSGEIYQYVGDEVVVTWKTQEGLSKANCIKCYFEMIRLLQDKSDYFMLKYGVLPKFKAGLHYGYVFAGEMGMIKREIVYSGDVLNTASRIQSLCNELKSEIIISKKLIEKVNLSFLNKRVRNIGEINLRGKLDKIELVTLQNVNV